MPIAWAPTAGRVRSKVAIDGVAAAGAARPRGPGPAGRRASPCRRAGSGRAPARWSSTTSAVCEARMPCLWNFWPWLSPLVPGGTTKLAWPRVRSSGSTTAVTTWTSAMPPLVAQVLVPLRTHSSLASSYVARVRIAPTSEPASGSEEQNAAELEVARACRTSAAPTRRPARRCRWRARPAAASAVPTIERPMPASPQNSSSIVIGMPSPVSSKAWVAKKSRE